MKALKTLPVLLLVIMINLVSCKKDKNEDPPKEDVLPTPIANLVSQSMIDSLRARGAIVHTGTTPPNVNGIYLMQPDSCIYDNSPGGRVGVLYADYLFRFSNQNNSSFTLKVEQKVVANGVLSQVPVATYISGNGNNFSIFTLRTVSVTGIDVEQYNVLSGTVVSGGIQNFQNTLYIRSKGADPSNLVAPAGTVRVFVNGAPGLAKSVPNF